MEHVPLKCNFERSQNHIKQVAEQLQSDPEGNIPIGLWVDGVAVAYDKRVSLEFQSHLAQSLIGRRRQQRAL